MNQPNAQKPSESRAAAKERRAHHRHTRCVMLLPDDLEGKRVLDIGCRNGLGAFKIADRVGPAGFVLGTDPDPQRLATARDRASQQHWAHENWESHLRFVEASASTLHRAGLVEASFDVVVVNSVLNLEPSLEEALRQIARVLAPGGLLYHDAVLACQELPCATAAACRDACNVFGCAPTRAALGDALARAGFTSWDIADEKPLEVLVGDERADLEGFLFVSALVQARVP